MDETALLIQKAQNGDIEAKSRLVSQNSALIWSIVKKQNDVNSLEAPRCARVMSASSFGI